jgi:hypothetical protein
LFVLLCTWYAPQGFCLHSKWVHLPWFFDASLMAFWFKTHNTQHTTHHAIHKTKKKRLSFHMVPYLSYLLLDDAKATSLEIIKIHSPHGKSFRASNQCKPNTWHKL